MKERKAVILFVQDCMCVWMFFAVVDDLVSRTMHFLPDYLSISVCLYMFVVLACL